MQQLFETARPTAAREALELRSCSDCTDYKPVSTMTATPAGNVICPRCAKRRANLVAERDQLSMWGQNALF